MFHHPTDSAPRAHTLRVLVVEDNLLIAETLCDALETWGCVVVGPVPDLPRSLALLDQDPPDAALLDINLGGTLSFPLAEILEKRGVPFVFMTGYDDGVVFPPEFREVRRLSKPFDSKDLTEVLEVWARLARG
ncbi:response regulator [Dongia sp.]|uniref:response regulator n=1 Tax=Dongia sp. TaxID=1977262 RepID=UPI003751A9E1